MNFSNKAMGLVSYPFVVLSKSAKVIPVILVGALRRVYKPDTKQYLVAIFISSGLVLFNLGKLEHPLHERLAFRRAPAAFLGCEAQRTPFRAFISVANSGGSEWRAS